MPDTTQVDAKASYFSTGWVLAGLAIGLTRAISKILPSAAGSDQMRAVDRKMVFLEASVLRIEDRTSNLEIMMAEKISRQQMDLLIQTAVEAAFRPLAHENDRRLAVQEESVHALRTMIGRTDELLGRVLEHLETPVHSHAA